MSSFNPCRVYERPRISRAEYNWLELYEERKLLEIRRLRVENKKLASELDRMRDHFDSMY